MTQGSCARCGNPLPADGSSCACSEAGTGGWGGLDRGPKPAPRAASRPLNEGSGLLREPINPFDDVLQGNDPFAEGSGPVGGPPKPRNEGSGLLRGPGKPRNEGSGLLRGPGKPQEGAGSREQPANPKAARKAEASRPLREPSRPLRTQSGSLDTSDADKSVARALPDGAPGRRRAESGPLHPALRGSAPQARAARVAAAKTATPRAAQASVPLEADTGLTGFGDPFGTDVQNDAGPQLELASQAPPPPGAQIDVAAPPGPEPANQNSSQQQLLARKIAQLSGYGPVPQKLLHTVAYSVRVARRKRALSLQLSARTLHRKQLELVAENALVALGEALFGQRNDPRLAALASQLRAAQTSREQIGTSVEAGKRAAQSRKREFEALNQALDQRQKDAAPVEQRAQAVGQRIAAGRARVRELEERMRAIEAETKALKASTDQATLDQIVTLDAERQAAWGEVQSLNIELLPLGEDHVRLEGEAAAHAASLSELQEQQSRLLDAAERDEQRKVVATGGARSAYRSALSAVAQAAIRADLAVCAPAALAHHTSAQAPIADARQNEQLVRAALSSYDPTAYKRGLQLVAGCIIASFLLFAGLIAF